jgi:Spy/CpxP family protein refolding chaperone
MIRTRIITIAIAFLIFSSMTHGQSSEGQQVQMTQPIFRQLGLTAEQLSKIREINQRQRPRLQQANLAVERARTALDETIYSEDASEEKLKEALTRFNKAQGDLATLRMQTEFEIRKVLTGDQLKQFRQMRQSRQEPRRMGPRGGPGRGGRDMRTRP